MADIERSAEEISEEHNEALSRSIEKPRWPSMTYEQGVRDALGWVLGESEDAPLTGQE